MLPGKMEVVHAEIPGDGSTTQEVAIGGHLYEAYIKQGANDDNSGCALTLEIGRAYLKLIKKASCRARNARSTSSGCRRSAAPTRGSTRIPTRRRTSSAT